MSDKRPARACVLGTGTMGAQIALSLAMGGVRVRLWGRRQAGLDDALERIEGAHDFLEVEGLAGEAKSTVLNRIHGTGNLKEAASGSGFVLEAVSEEIGLKQRLLRLAESHAPRDAILSSTTSAISASDLQSVLAHPERFCIAHYVQPAHLVPLVEVVPGKLTDADSAEKVIHYLESTDKAPVLCPDIPGFLWARIQHAVLREFASLVGKGLVDPQTCDRILKEGYAMRLPAMGAFEHADLAGLDLLNSDAARAVWADLSNVASPDETPVGALYRQGHTGMRSGRGFYNWEERDPLEFTRQRDAEIVRRRKLDLGARVVLR